MSEPKPCCKDWEKQKELYRESVVGWVEWKQKGGKKFNWCPWCGKKITKVKGKK